MVLVLLVPLQLATLMLGLIALPKALRRFMPTLLMVTKGQLGICQQKAATQH